MKKIFKILVVLLSIGVVSACGKKDENLTNIQKEAKELIRTKNIRIVIPSKSTGGDTYQVSNLISRKLGEVLGKNVKVDAVGTFDAMTALKRSKDGSTLMFAHDITYLGYLYKTSGYNDIKKEFTFGPTLAVNPGNAFLAPKNSKFNTVRDVLDAVVSGEKVRVAVQPGSVSEIGFSAMRNEIKLKSPEKVENLIPIYTGSQADKNQILFDGQADIIHGYIQSNEQFTQLPENDQKAMKFIWLSSSEEALKGADEQGFGSLTRDDLLKLAIPNITVMETETKNFTFDKDFFVLYNKETNSEINILYEKALKEVFEDKEFTDEMRSLFFIPSYRNISNSASYMADKIDSYEIIINSIK